jgi:hypothetical protein
MRDVARNIKESFEHRPKGRVDIRGCNGALIKLPLQFDPHHRRVILPYDDDGNLIEGYEEAVEFAADIKRNDPSTLWQFLDRPRKKTVSSGFTQTRHSEPAARTRSKSSPSTIPKSSPLEIPGTVKDLVERAIVGEGQSNDFVFEAVRMCWWEGVRKEDIPELFELIYEKGCADGRITCRASLGDWLNKAKHQAKKYYSIKGERLEGKPAVFYADDFHWIRRHSRLSTDPLFLAVVLWARRLSDNPHFFLAQSTAVKHGLTRRKFDSAKRRFLRSGLLHVVERGRQRPPRRGQSGWATVYKLQDDPEDRVIVKCCVWHDDQAAWDWVTPSVNITPSIN